MEIVTCPSCHARVAVMADGNCPSCRNVIKDEAGSIASDGSITPFKTPLKMSSAPDRPTSITVISWLLIVTSGMNVITSLTSLNNPAVLRLMERSLLPIPVQFILLYVGLAIAFACGVAMLNGENWGRWLYVIWSGIGLVVALATSPMKLLLIPGALIYFLVAFFLFRPNASAYFAGAGANHVEAA